MNDRPGQEPGAAAVPQRLAAELAELTARLERVRAELAAWNPGDVPSTSVPPPGGGEQAGPGRVGDQQVGTQQVGSQQVGSQQVGQRQAWPQPGWPPTSPTPHAWPRQAWTRQGQPQPGLTAQRPVPPQRPRPVPAAGGSTGRLLAWVGGGITLLGIVLLLVLAATQGWFGPAARVIAGALLGCALVGVGVWVYRKPEGRTGALALVATGVAALYLDVAAATTLYEFIPLPLGLVLAFAVAAGGGWLAARWGSQLLAVGAVIGAALLAPVLIGVFDWVLVALTLALQIAGLPAVRRHGWAGLAGTTQGAAALYGTLAAVWSSGLDAELATTVALCFVLLVGLAQAVLTTDRVPDALVAGTILAAALPSLVQAVVLGRWWGTAVAAGVAVVLLAAAAVGRLPVAARIGAVSGAAVAGFLTAVISLDGATLTMVLLGGSVALSAVAAATRRRLPLAVAAGYGVFGLGRALVRDLPLAALAEFPRPPFVVGGVVQTTALLTGAAVALLLLAAAVAGLIAAARVGWLRDEPSSAAVWAPLGAVALYGATGLVVTVALLVAGNETGFLAGQAIATVSWTVAALLLLARGISRPALRIAGTVLVVAAVAKLILFDLIALDGLARVAAFLGAGLVLLVAGSRYARLVARARAIDESSDEGADTASDEAFDETSHEASDQTSGEPSDGSPHIAGPG